MQETAKHPSMSSVLDCKRVNAVFRPGNEQAAAAEIAQCPLHGTPEKLDQFWKEFDSLNAQIQLAAEARHRKVMRPRWNRW
jgi:hypothetical protein